MNIKLLEDMSEPPVELSDKYYCKISTNQGIEQGWWFRDLVKGKRKGWKVVYVSTLGTTEDGEGILRWRKRIVNPRSFVFIPRFPIRASREMQLARCAKTERQRDKWMTVVREEQGLYWCPDFNTWKRIDGDI